MKLSSIGRINLTIVAVTIAAILLAQLLGVIPDERTMTARSRIEISQTLATNISFLVAKREFDEVQVQLELFSDRNDALISAGLRRSDGAVVADVGEHTTVWDAAISKQVDGCYQVPILSDSETWGHLELHYQPIYVGEWAVVSPAVIGLLSILVPLIGIAAYLHLKRILKYLDPSQAVPPRVRQTLDSFAEGVVLLDKKLSIVLANDAFATLFHCEVEELLGLEIRQLPFSNYDNEDGALPWELTKKYSKTVNGRTVRLKFDETHWKIFSANSSPVLDEDGRFQGIMVALADVTPLEQKREELASTLAELNESKDEITKQNEELRYLATRDPLTGCINRRTFFEQFESFFERATDGDVPLCAVMVDIDFFKSINDNYGHSKGDEVLRETGKLLIETARKEDVVCRYGGEEFSVLMPGVQLDEAVARAEDIRQRMAKLDFGDITITASLGLSAVGLGAEDPQDLLDQADKCLYVAKRNGRNQVVRFDDVPEDLQIDESKISRTKPAEESAAGNSIPFSAVNALLSALSYRDAQTGAHSSRVSALSAQLAQQYLGPKDVYVIEIAGLLHDIGKAADHELEGGHPKIGADLLRRHGESPQVVHAALGHHDDIVVEHPYTMIVATADACSASRPGARRESLERYVKRMEELEAIAKRFDGVREAYAISAGRELRVIVDSTSTNDEQAAVVCHEIAKAFEKELLYPGEIKVTVLRETVFTETAK